MREGSVINLNERMKSISIEGVGCYLPERVVTNDDLSKIVDTSDEWIRTRTGIGERHLAAEDEACSSLACGCAGVCSVAIHAVGAVCRERMYFAGNGNVVRNDCGNDSDCRVIVAKFGVGCAFCGGSRRRRSDVRR